MRNIARPLPFVLASTNTGTMILNYLDRNQTQYGAYGVGYQFLNTASFDKEEISNVIALLNLRREYFGDGVFALDCGANIGAHAIEWGIEMTGWGELIAFEAQERIYYALAGNIAINNCFNVRALNVALGNPKKKGGGGETLEIPSLDYTKPASFGSFELKQSENREFIGQEPNFTKTQKVPLISIDSLKLKRVDLMKIDVEKMEMEVLKGAEATIKAHKPILIIEIIKSNQAEIVKLLESWEYQMFPMGMNILAIHKNDPVLTRIVRNP